MTGSEMIDIKKEGSVQADPDKLQAILAYYLAFEASNRDKNKKPESQKALLCSFYLAQLLH